MKCWSVARRGAVAEGGCRATYEFCCFLQRDDYAIALRAGSLLLLRHCRFTGLRWIPSNACLVLTVDCSFAVLAEDGDDTPPATATGSHSALSRGQIAGIVVAGVVLLVFGFLSVFSKAECWCECAPSRGDFATVLGDVLSGCERVVDVAMLGAHDAFTCDISGRSEGECAGVKRMVASGAIVRFARAQVSTAEALLRAGVRYFDVRVAWVDGDWWTVHRQLSGPLSDSLRDIVRFLVDHPREFVVFDVQRARFGPIESLWQCLADVQYLGTNLLDLVSYDPSSVGLESLTYGDVTCAGGGVVLLLPTPMTPGCKHYERGAAIRSVWHNQVSTERMLEAIAEEYGLLRANPGLDRDRFRVNQAVRTPVLGSCGNLCGSLCAWSLLDMAASFNRVVVDHEHFAEWLRVLPIVMVDFADLGRGDFNAAINAKIGAFNALLRPQEAQGDVQ